MIKTISSDLTYAAILTVVNTVLLAIIMPSASLTQFTYLSNTIVFLILIAFLGYGLGKVGDGVLILTEVLSIAFVIVYIGQYAYVWSFIRDQLVFSLLIFSAGVFLGSSFLRNIRFEIKSQLSKEFIDCRSAAMAAAGIAGFTLLLVYIATTINRFMGAHILILSITPFGIIFSILNGLILAIVLGGKLVSKLTLTVLSSFLVYLSGLSTPLVVTLVRRSGSEALSSRRVITIGNIVRVLSNSQWVRGRGKLNVSIELGRENNHMVIVGASGTGKSNLCKKIISQLRHYSIPVLVIDVHGEYRSLEDARIITPLTDYVNILDTMGKSPEVRAREVADLISSAFRLGNVQRLALTQIILELYEKVMNPTLQDLREVVEDYLSSSKELGTFDREVLRSILPYIRSLVPSDRPVRWFQPEEVLSSNITVVDLSVVNDMSLIRIYVETLLESLFYTAQLVRSGLFIVMEEVHRFSSRGRKSIVPKLFMEGRKFGIAVIAVTQDPLSVEPAIFTNTKLIINYIVPEASSSSYMAKILSGNDLVKYKKIRETLTALKQFEALVWIRGGKYIYMVKT
ncbi:MAG: ATP-binding protein [Desulfurococcales archaeon]|nr:ATP-binding protein [Desulfurococcales archaeon]